MVHRHPRPRGIKRSCFLLALSLLLPSAAFTDPPETKNMQNHGWELGTESYMFHYREPGLMHDNAWMWGAYVSYTYRGWVWPAPVDTDRWMLRFEGRYARGRPDYHGALQDGRGNLTPYKTWDGKDRVVELRAVEGYGFGLPGHTVLTPYSGFAYRYLNDRPPSGDPYGYERESNYYYSPLGIETASRFGSWVAGSNFEYDYFWYGEQYSYLYPVIKNHQHKGYGVRASLRLVKENRRVDIVVEPFVRYWHIKQSERSCLDLGGGMTAVFTEPDNRTLETGIRVGVGF